MVVVVKGNRHQATVAAWFSEAGEAPFPVGTCLFYRSEEAAA